MVTVNCHAFLLNASWEIPNKRVDNTVLLPSELLLYEIRGYDRTGKVVWSAIINNGLATSYLASIPDQLGVVQYKIAAADTKKLYSDFVVIAEHKYIAPPTEGIIE